MTTSSKREDLEELRDVLIARLTCRSDDFDATRELRLVYASLQQLPLGKQTVTADS